METTKFTYYQDEDMFIGWLEGKIGTAPTY